MHISEFDYEVPEELIAQQPLPERDASRMLVLNRETQSWVDSSFRRFPNYLRSGDVLVVNNTRVFAARLKGRRDPSGGRVEMLLLRELEPNVWEALVRPGHKLKQGALVRFGDSELTAQLLDGPGGEVRRVRFEGEAPVVTMLERLGQMPLPPYISRPEGATREDRDRYQTVFARERGAVAAPTAGLHFTPGIIAELKARQVQLAEITLHVGYGTFEPVRVTEVAQHKVAPEFYQISPADASTINSARKNGGRVIAVGTTTTRALESAANSAGLIEAAENAAELTITPGYEFRVIDALLTNFHLPRSSLLLLVCAFAGRDLLLESYRHAVDLRYRFYSYGDCMLVM